MTDMNIEQRKVEMFAVLAEVEADIETLKKNIASAREDLPKVQTKAEAKAFDRSHDLEEGLKHIELF